MSTIRIIQIFIKLLPSIFALRRDRKKWIHQERTEIDSEQFRKNARKVLNTFISLGPVYIKLGQWLSSSMNSRNSFGTSISFPGMIARSSNCL